MTELIHDEKDQLIAVELEAVINRNQYQLDWLVLKDSEQWLMGWK